MVTELEKEKDRRCWTDSSAEALPPNGLCTDLSLHLHVSVNIFYNILFLFFVNGNKSLIKLTKTRIDVMRRKKNATQKFLKKDIADLLLNGLDINAYGRVITPSFRPSFCFVDFTDQS